MIYRFLGTSSEIYGVVELRQFGQSVELPDALAGDAIIGNCPLIPAATFDGIFTADDARRYASPAARMDAPKEFADKLKGALVALHDFRVGLESPAPPVTATKEKK